MRKWRIVGQKASGEQITIEVMAEDRGDARRQAHEAGLTPLFVEPIDDWPGPANERPADQAADDLWFGETPGYGRLAFCCNVLVIIAAITAAGALTMLLVAGFQFVTADNDTRGPAALAWLGPLLTALSLLTTAAVLGILAYGGLALRDIALAHVDRGDAPPPEATRG